MGNMSSAKGNPASKRMMNPNNKAKRARNKLINEQFEKVHGVSRKAYRNLKWEGRKKDRALARATA